MKNRFLIVVLLFVSSQVFAGSIALWDMDSFVTATSPYFESVDTVLDIDGKAPDNHLFMGRRQAGGSAGAYNPSLVAGTVGNAIYFDGDDHAYAYTAWDGSLDDVRIEFDFKPEGDAVWKTIAAATNSWWIRTGFNSSGTYGKVDFYVYDGGAAKLASSYFMPIASYMNNWHRVIAEVDGNGNVTCELVGATAGGNVTTTVAGIDNPHHSTIHLGGRWTNTDQFQGAIDEMSITSIPEPATLCLLSLGLALIRRK